MQVCEEGRVNYNSLIKVMKKSCQCKTKLCPNWQCCCDNGMETDEVEDVCSCPPCDCNDCTSCQVGIRYNNHNTHSSFYWSLKENRRVKYDRVEKNYTEYQTIELSSILYSRQKHIRVEYISLD